MKGGIENNQYIECWEFYSYSSSYYVKTKQTGPKGYIGGAEWLHRYSLKLQPSTGARNKYIYIFFLMLIIYTPRSKLQ